MKKYSLFVLVGAVVLGSSLFINSNAHAQIAVTLPSVPTGVSASVVASSQISVTWAASTESSGTIEGYYIYRNGSRVATTADTSFVDAGLTSGLYQYTVAAYDANNNISAQSSPASVTLVIDTTPPTVPTGVTISGPTSTNSYNASTTLTISWNPSTDNVGVTGYNVYRSGVWINSSTPISGNSITDSVVPGQYSYVVDAYDAAQNFSADSSPVTVGVYVDSITPSVPKNISAQQTAADSVMLSWANSTDGVGIAGYQVFQNNTQIATAAGSPYAVTGLSLNTQYTFAVTAIDNVGNISGQSYPPASINIQAITGPSIPVIVSAAPVGTSSVQVSWATVLDPLAIASYNLYRNAVQIAAVTSTSYLDTGLAPGTYAYTLSATDVTGAVSATSSPVNGVVSGIQSAPVTPSTPTSGGLTSSGTLSTGFALSAFTQSLYFGLRGAQVQALQSLLVGQGYLPAVDATGFFGNLTLHAVQQFQCAQSVVCTNGPGWGIIGPKTRNILNELLEQGTASSSSSTSVSISASTSSSMSAAAMLAEVQALEGELASLEKQL